MSEGKEEKKSLFSAEVSLSNFISTLLKFKYFLVFQRKINKIQEFEIPPDSMGFLLEESCYQQPPAPGTLMLTLVKEGTCYSNSWNNI